MGVYDYEGDIPSIHTFGRKMKLLEVMRILERETDAEHALTANQIIKKLKAKGYERVARKDIYDDVNVLNKFYEDSYGDVLKTVPRIEREEGTWGYYMDNRPLSFAALKLVIDAIQSSKFLSEAKTIELIDALETFCSVHQAKGLKRQVIVTNRVKNMNTNIHNNVDHINAAIEADVCIRFKYFDYGVKMNRIFRKNNAWYEVSPLALVYCDDNYYLVGYVPSEEKVKNYRVDRMASIGATRKQRTGKEHFTKEELGHYQSYTFKMYSGTVQDITMRFRNHLMNVVVNKFGSQKYAKAIEADRFEITVPVAVSPQFYSWIFGLRDGVEIVSPPEVREGMRTMLEKALEHYE